MTVPSYLRVDIATACQLRCPSCPTASGEIKQNLGSGWMRADAFGQLLDANPRVRDIELSNWGEICLNPQLSDILRLAHQRKVRLHADNGVNLNHVPETVLEDMVRYHLYSMTCSIDGANDGSYSLYRVGGKLENVLKNIRKLNAYKAKYKSRYPILTWQFIVFAHNQHEIDKARAMAKSLGMRFYPKLSWNDQYTPESFSPVIDSAAVKKALRLDIASRQEYEEKYHRPYMQREICSQLWNSPQINWDGRMLGCCVNYWGDFGNVLQDGLANVLKGEPMRYARRMLQGKLPAKEGIPCTTCKHYLKIRETRQWMTPGFIIRNRFYWWLALRTVINPKSLWYSVLRVKGVYRALFR